MQMMMILLLFSLLVCTVVIALPISHDDINNNDNDNGNKNNSNVLRLIQWKNESVARWMTEDELQFLISQEEAKEIASGKPNWYGWADWTLIPNKITNAANHLHLLSSIPAEPIYQQQVNSILANLNYTNLNYTIGTLENYNTRMYNTDTGVDSALWLRDEFIRLSAGSSLNISVSLYEHNGWDQPSVIAIMEGDGSTDEILVMGAHLDSTSISPNGRAPGADDDGCGVATILEMFRLTSNFGNFRPKRAIHWMLYAAEEVGLRGSSEIANEYNFEGVNIYAVYQSEMCGWVGSNPSIVVIDDSYTDGDLVDFSVKLINEYCEYPPDTDACNSACSDHASWDRIGSRTICTAEAGPSGELNPNYHRATDLLEYMDTEYASDFVRYGVAFAVELSQAA